MPQNDLGTAHGRVKIDADTSGATKAAASLLALQKQAAALEKSFANLDKSISGRSGGIVGFSRNVNTTRAATRGLTSDLSALVSTATKVGKIAAPFVAPTIALNKFNQSLKASSGNLTSFGSALKGTGLASASIGLLVKSFLGLGNAMKAAPTWERNIYKYSTAVGGLVAGTAFIAKHTNAVKLADRAINFFNQRHAATARAIWATTGAVKSFHGVLDNLSSSTTKSVLGLAVMSQGLKGLQKDFAWLGVFSKGPLLALVSTFGIIPAAVQAAGKTLTWFSNILVGLWDAIKQVSGALYLLPAAYATLGGIVATVALGFSGLKDAMKAVVETDPKKFQEQWDKLPPQLKNVVKAARDVVPAWKGLRDEVQKKLLVNVDKDIANVTKALVEPLKGGMGAVANAINQAKSRLVEFVTAPQNVSELNRSFKLTSDIVNNLSRALKPFLSGIKDISIVGQEALRDLTRNAGSFTQLFANFFAKARASGDLRRWIDDGVNGIKDLIRGTLDLTKALWTVLTMFKTHTGDNALEIYADSMKKFNDAVQKSAAEGVLKRIADTVKGLGTSKIQDLVTLLKDVYEAAVQIGKALYGAFTGGFISALRLALNTVEAFFKVLNAFGAGPILGTFLTIVTTWKTFAFVLNPIRHTIMGIWGAFAVGGGATKLIATLSNTLSNFGPIGVKASGALKGLATNIGAIGLAAAAAIAAFALIKHALDQMTAGTRALNDLTNNGTDAVNNFTEAWTRAGGTLNKDIFTSVLDQVDTFKTRLDTMASSGPGLMDQLVLTFKEGLGNIGEIASGDIFAGLRQNLNFVKNLGSGNILPAMIGEQAADLQRNAEAAKALGNALGQLGITNQDLAKAISGTNAEFDDLFNQLQGAGLSNTALNYVIDLRNAWLKAKSAMEQIGPETVQLADGLNKIKDAGNNATEALDGLKTALQALGLLETDAEAAAADLAQEVYDLGQAGKDGTSAWVNEQEKLGDVLIKNGKLDIQNQENARRARQKLLEVSDKYLASIAAGNDETEARRQALAAVDEIAKSLKVDPKILEQIFSQDFGGANTPVVPVMLDVMKHKDQFYADVAQLYAQALKEPGTQEIKAKVDPKSIPEIKKWVEQNGGQLEDLGAGAIRITGISDEQVAQYVKDVDAKLEAGKPSVEPEVKVDEAQVKTEASKIESVFGQVISDIVSGAGQRLGQGFNNIGSGLRSSLGNIFNNIKDNAINAMAGILPGVMTTFENIKGAIVQKFYDIVTSVTTILNGIVSWFTNLPNSINNAFASVVNSMKQKGIDMIVALAQGIYEAKSQLPPVMQKIIDTIIDFWPASPAKKGPFSGTGAPVNRGRNLISQYSEGIASGSREAGTAAQGAASSAAQGLTRGASARGVGLATGRGLDMGPLIYDINDILGLGKSILDLIESIADIGFSLFKIFTTNPLTGESILPKRYVKTVSDEQLAQKRRMALQGNIPAPGDKSNLSFGGQDLSAAERLAAGQNIQLTATSSKEEIQAAFIQQAKKRGLSDQEIIASLAAMQVESGFNPTIIGYGKGGGGANAIGLFQQTEGMWGTAAELSNPNIAIQKYLDAYMKNRPKGGLSGNALVDYIWHGVQRAGDPNYGSKMLAAMQDQSTNIGNMADDIRAAQKPGQPGGLPGASVTYDKAWAQQHGYAPLYTPGEYPTGTSGGLPSWIYTLAKAFGLEVGSSISASGATSLHGAGLAFDISGSQENMDKFAAFVSQKLGSQVLQMIYQSPTLGNVGIAGGQRVGAEYYTGDTFAQHASHIHLAFAGTPKLDNLTVDSPAVDINSRGADDRQAQFNQEIIKTIIDEANKRGLSKDQISAAVAAAATMQKPGDQPGTPLENAKVFMDQLARAPQDIPVWDQALYTEAGKQSNYQSNLLDANKDINDYLRLNNTQLQNLNASQLDNLATNEQIMDATYKQYPELQAAVNILNDQSSSVEKVNSALGTIDYAIGALKTNSSVEAQTIVQELESQKAAALERFGMEEAANPADLASNIISGVTGIASDFFGVFEEVMKSITATQNIGNILVRGIANTKDINNLIDNLQQYLMLGARIAQATGDVLSTIGGIVGSAGGAAGMGAAAGGDMGATAAATQAVAIALGAAGGIAQTIGSVLSSISAAIDIGQAIVRIAGKYVGRILTQWLGGIAGPLEGEVKLLLDETTGTLMAWSASNPQLKNELRSPFMRHNERQFPINYLTVYGGPGQDPRDTMDQAMWAIRTAGVGSFGYG